MSRAQRLPEGSRLACLCWLGAMPLACVRVIYRRPETRGPLTTPSYLTLVRVVNTTGTHRLPGAFLSDLQLIRRRFSAPSGATARRRPVGKLAYVVSKNGENPTKLKPGGVSRVGVEAQRLSELDLIIELPLSIDGLHSPISCGIPESNRIKLGYEPCQDPTSQPQLQSTVFFARVNTVGVMFCPFGELIAMQSRASTYAGRPRQRPAIPSILTVSF